MADDTKGQSTMRGLMVALVVIAVLGGLYGIFSAMEAGFDRMRGQLDSANRETSLEIKGLREMTRMILEHERQEAEREGQGQPAAAPAPAAPVPGSEAAVPPAPTKGARAPAPTGGE